MDATKKTKPADALLRIPAKASQTHRPGSPAAAMAYAPFLKKVWQDYLRIFPTPFLHGLFEHSSNIGLIVAQGRRRCQRGKRPSALKGVGPQKGSGLLDQPDGLIQIGGSGS